MRMLLPLPMLLAACSQPADNTTAPVPRLNAIAGVYEGDGRLTMPNRICLTGEGTDARFGLVMGSDGRRSCTARGRVNQAGSKLTLVIDGDPACMLTGSITGTSLDLNAATGRECGYFCGGQGTRFSTASFRKNEAVGAEARPVADLVGDPLC